jgi:hypothetical protein
MEIHEPDASRRHDEDASAPEAYRVYTTTTSCRHMLKGPRYRETVHHVVAERLQDERVCHVCCPGALFSTLLLLTVYSR